MLFPCQYVSAADKTSDISAVAIDISEKININTASSEQLVIIKGIGIKKAQTIIAYRQQNGDFVSFEQLLKVKGIGQSTLVKMTPFLTL
jgi:competence protein ComEA